MQNFQKRYSSVIFSGVLLLAFALAHAAGNLVQDMVRFDQAYIPALAMTSDEKPEPSRVAFSALLVEWESLKKAHFGEKSADQEWKSDFNKVDGYIGAAGKIIARGTNLKDAHEELEHIRVVFMRLRDRNGIDYYIDHLTRFHEPMEEIVLAAKGKTESTLADKDLVLIRQTLPRAKELWHATKTAEFNGALYGFNQQKTSMLHSLVEKEQAALQHLEQALQTKNKQAIISAAVAIKPNFAKIFKSFGRFPKT